MEFRACDPRAEPACSLIEAMVAEMVALYEVVDGHVGVPLDHGEMAPPGGVYLVGYDGDQPVAGGGLRTVGPHLGEIKRMYVDPDRRGRGLARALLNALEEEARRLGMTTVRLDTGPDQPEARHLYESAGYVPIENYNGNRHAAFWGEKRLSGGVGP